MSNSVRQTGRFTP